jgi:MFS family permease
MSLGVIVLPMDLWTLMLIFVLGGIYVAMEETLEDSFCAELVGEEHHGMAFGTLATVNGIGDFASSIIVGLLWTGFGTSVAFLYSAALAMLGGCLVLRVTLRS